MSVAAANAAPAYANLAVKETRRKVKGLGVLSNNSADSLDLQIGLICTALAVGIFVVDVTSLPLGVAAGVAYVAVVLISLWMSRWQYSVAVASIVSILTIIGYFWSEPAGILWMVVANRLLALFAIWLTVSTGGWLVFTRRKKSEEALRQAEQVAEQARNAKSRFLETTSNDMRQHLQTLSLLGGAIRKTATGLKVQELCTMQNEAIVHLGDLLNQILELCELESGEVKPNIGEAPIQDIFQPLREEFEFQAQAKGLQLEVDSKHDVAYSDPALLRRIVRVLVSNAIRYTEHGAISVACQRELDNLRITVQDSGIGIAPDKLARIFDEFYRVENDPVGGDVGLGLGLSIVERSVNLLGTKMEVESKPGQGSSFSLLVPAYRESAVSKAS